MQVGAPGKTHRLRAALLSGTAAVAATFGTANLAAAQVTTSFTVTGQVTSPRTFTLSQLEALSPTVTENVSFTAGTTQTNTTFTGVSLWNLLNNVGIVTNPSVKNDILNEVVVVTGSDGYQSVSSLGEIDPTFGGYPSGGTEPNYQLIAYANGPGQLLTTDGFARSTAPGDVLGGRYVSNVSNIEVLHAPVWTNTFSGGISTSFVVNGMVNASTTYNLASLEALPATTVTVAGSPATTYTGVSLWTLLTTVGVTTNPAIKNNILRDYVIATGSDGYTSTVSLGEIDPSFGGSTTTDIIAYSQNGGAPGTSLGSNGDFRLITAADNSHGRFVSNLVDLEVFDVSNWIVLPNQSIDLTAFAYQTLGFQLAGGTLTSSGGAGVLTAPTYALQGGLIDTNANLGATGAVTQSSGLTMLKGTIETTNVAITGGTLQLEGNNRLATGTTLSLTGGNFDLNGFGQTIGSLTGGGTVLLSSNASGGVLTVGSGSFSGSIQNNGSQPGGLVVSGPGTLTLTGINTYTGATTINGGALEVDGSIAGTTGVTVGSGGVLSGTGNVDPPTTTIATGGTLSPGNAGNPTGKLTITGNLAFQSGALYAISVSNTASSSTTVTGTAALGGTVRASFAAGTVPQRQYTILVSSGLNGTTFSGLSTANQPAGFNASLGYTANDVLLNVTAALGAGASLNANAQNTASTINASFNNTGSLPPGFAPVFGLSAPALGTALAQLDGEAATDARRGAFQMTDQFLGLMLDPFADGGSGAGWPIGGGASARAFAPEQETALPPDIALAYASILTKAPPAQPLEQRWSAWGSGFGGGSNANGDPAAGSSNVTATDYGYAGGLDYHVSRDSVVGFALAGGGTNWGLAQNLGSGRSDSFQAGVYGVTRWGPAYLASAVPFANHWMTTNRTSFAGDQLTASFDAQSFSGRIEGGYRYAVMTTAGVTPYAALQAQNFHTPTFSEADLTGGGFGLTYASQNATDTRGELGARFDDLVALNDKPIELRGRLAWAHDWVDNPALSAVFQALPGSSFIVNGAPLPKNSALTTAGAVLHLTPALSFAVKFDGEFASSAQTYAGSGTLRYTW